MIYTIIYLFVIYFHTANFGHAAVCDRHLQSNDKPFSSRPFRTKQRDTVVRVRIAAFSARDRHVGGGTCSRVAFAIFNNSPNDTTNFSLILISSLGARREQRKWRTHETPIIGPPWR